MKVKQNMLPLTDMSITGKLRIKLGYYYFLNTVLMRSSFYDVYLAYIFSIFTKNFVRTMVNLRPRVLKCIIFSAKKYIST